MSDTLYIYKGVREKGVGYDEYDAMVVFATCVEDAIIIANVNCGDEGEMRGNMREVKRTKIGELYKGYAEGKNVGLILGSFNAG